MSDERKWFFTDSDLDLRGNLAAKALMDPARASALLRVENYEPSSLTGEQRKEDVSHEVADFIVDTALFHRKLDPSGVQKDLNDPTQFKVYSHVYRRWANLSPESQAFYNKYMSLLKKDPLSGRWTKVRDVNEMAKAENDKSNYRINLEKDANGEPIFAQNLPTLTPEHGRVWYSTNRGLTSYQPHEGVWPGESKFGFGEGKSDFGKSKEEMEGSFVGGANGKNFYREIYNSVYLGRPSEFAPGLKTTESNKTHFNINVDNLVRKKMFAISQAEVKEGEQLPPIGEETMFGMIDRDIIKRDASGKLYREIGGQRVYLGAEDEETKRLLKASHACYSTGIKTDEATCKKFIFECLLSQDPDSLNKCLASLRLGADFFNVATSDIKNIHPVLALRILQQFGFRKYQKYDPQAGQQLWKVESVKHWLENYMAKKFNVKDIRSMIKQPDQHYLMTYLDLLSQYVNANPAILNKGYTGTSEEVVGVYQPSDLGKALGLSVAVDRRSLASDLGRLGANMRLMSASRQPIFVPQQGRQFMATPFGSSLTPGVSMLVPPQMQMGQMGLMMGGGSGHCEQVASIFIQNNGGSAMLQQFLNSAIQKLERKGKKLNSKDRERIDQYLAKNKEIEKELVKTYCYIDEYNQLLDMFGDTAGAKNLSKETLMQLVNRQESLIGKQGTSQQQIMQLFAKLLEVMGEEAGANMEPVKVSDAL
ncbi:MAG: hypothetical protein Barrevirus15_4 [Barrevirus sp.]|uniref:Uncharacterized protein n=1 Tax=Barrevirus sp. TaxID=2487763 RepID=A0A3G4ZQI3_9VIRU|nr:MAG: hypothetical protein Barrevirus15_4 [Barrevirus sp.]